MFLEHDQIREKKSAREINGFEFQAVYFALKRHVRFTTTALIIMIGINNSLLLCLYDST